MMPKKNDPLTLEEVTEAADIFMPLFDAVYSRMPEGSKVEDCLSVMESVAKLGHKLRSDKADEEKKLKFGFNKDKEKTNEDT
jgi:hypothetical protein